MLTFIQTKEYIIWKSIPGWEEYYEVNEFGEVRNKITKHIIIGDINSAGYQRVALYKNGEQGKKYFRHRLVACLFLPNPQNLPEVNHIDGNKTNNHVDNLEWCNRIKNEHHARKKYKGLYKPFYVIYENDSRVDFEFTPELAKELGVTNRTIRNFLQKRSHNYTSYGIKEINYV